MAFCLPSNYKASEIKIYDLAVNGRNRPSIKIKKERHWGIVNQRVIGQLYWIESEDNEVYLGSIQYKKQWWGY